MTAAIADLHPAHLHTCIVFDAIRVFGCWLTHGRQRLARAVEAAEHVRPLPQALDKWFDELSTLRALVAAFSANHLVGKSQADMKYCFLTTGCATTRDRPGSQDQRRWPDQVRVAIPMPMAIDVVEWLRHHRSQQSLPDTVDMPPYGQRRAEQAFGWQGVGPIHALRPSDLAP